MHVRSFCFAAINPLLFMPFQLPSPSSLLKLPIYKKCRHQIVLVCVHVPRGQFQNFVFSPLPPSLGDELLHLLHFFADAEIIFNHILVSSACAIEMQHSYENKLLENWFGFSFPTIADSVPTNLVSQSGKTTKRLFSSFLIM